MSDFNRGDLGKYQDFITKKETIKKEFAAIKREFSKINTELLKNWKGSGAASYRSYSSHVMDNIGGISDVLDTISDNLLVDVLNYYNELDDALHDMNTGALEQEE